ncbi:MAG: carboxypeptidase-like regulatory domain-containing protein, partial [Actinobacteria bacterium]|nr:carboxypeptidase-like regulatory domain-containing protein [Actinomycetota bacterium]
RARRIQVAGDLVGGPLGQGQSGDWLLENCSARFVIQDAGKRDLHSIGQYGGNVIDAELVGRPNRDQFFELQPALNVETVINAQSVEIVNDGENGAPAIVRSCGPDDLVDYINPSSVVGDLGFSFPPGVDDTNLNIEACTEYRLAAGQTHLEVETFVMNHDPTRIGLFVGDYVNGMGQLEQWTPPTAGVGEISITLPNASAQSYFGFGSATGVDYAVVPVEIPDSPFATSSFTTSGVSFVAQSHSIITILLVQIPVFFVPGAVGGQPGENSFLRFFGVGDGSPSNAIDLQNEVFEVPVGRLRGCVTVGGAPAPHARVAVGPLAAGRIASLATLFVTDAAGCYEGTLAPGSWGAAASQEGTPYEGGGALPAVRAVTIVADQTSDLDLALPATGRVEVTVLDETGASVPARVSVVGFDPSSEPRIITSSGLDIVTTGLFRDVTKDTLPFGLAWIEYAGSDGRAAFDLEPGSYQVFVSRGSEYSAFDAPLAVVAGATTPVVAQIAHVLDTPGFISSDYHVHMLPSPDSRISL